MRKTLLALGAFGPRSRLRGRIEALLARGRAFSAQASAWRIAAAVAALLSLAAAASLARRWIAFAQPPAFEVASIRQHNGALQRVNVSTSGGRVVVDALSLHGLVIYAYNLKPYQLAGASFNGEQAIRATSWMENTRFDIAAEADSDQELSQDQARLMMRQLLADRFRLKIHSDPREMPVYALVAIDKPKLTPGSGDEYKATLDARNSPVLHFMVSNGTMERLAQQLTANGGVDRPVLDRTGLAGKYDYTLEWVSGTPAPDSNTPSLFTAVREQLGLRLESQRAPVEVFVIDHAEMPTEN